MKAFLSLFYSTSYKNNDTWRGRCVTSVSWIAVGLLGWALFKLRPWEGAKVPKEVALPWLAFWSLVPPLWFWVEYHLLYLGAAVANRATIEIFAHSQDCSRNIWLALAGLFVAIYFSGS